MESVDDLVLFAAVVEEGGFSGAGRALGVPKSRVSRRIAGLERRLGLRLLQRSTRKVQATDTGMAFYRRCAAVAEAARTALDVAEQARTKPSGRLRISCPVGIAYRFLAPGLPGFLMAHPDVRLELELSNRHVDLIADSIDVALRSRPTLEDPNLIVRTFGKTAQVLVASPDYVSRCGPFDTAAALSRATGLGPAGLHGAPPSWRLQYGEGDAIDIRYDCALMTDDLQLLLQSSLAGVGIAQLPYNLCAPAIDEGRLQLVLPDVKLPANQLHAVFPSRRGLAPAVRSFLDMLSEQVPAIIARSSKP